MPELAVAIFIGVAVVITFLWWRRRNFPGVDAPTPVTVPNISPSKPLDLATILPRDVVQLVGPEVMAQFRSAVESAATPVTLAPLRQTDPAFDEASFLRHARSVVTAIANAESSRNWEQVRPFMSDTCFMRWQATAQGKPVRKAGPTTVASFLIVTSVESTPERDRITIWSDTIDIRGLHRAPHTTEWTFVRTAARRSDGAAPTTPGAGWLLDEISPAAAAA